MVVADADPPRKRSRLSLKSRKGDNPPLLEDPEPPSLESAWSVTQESSAQPEQEFNDCSPPVISELTESDLPCEGSGVPPVASMENLGNTCFLNSVLEVLRYTPCFLEGLEELYRHIVYLEKVKATDVAQESEEATYFLRSQPSLVQTLECIHPYLSFGQVKTDRTLTWDLVKNMFKMYKRMEKREEMFSHFASADVTSMAVKPDKVLDIIRELNPMFEGTMQHDAQELLRCLLCYLEDSERDLHRDYAAILAAHPALLKSPVAPSQTDRQFQEGNGVLDKPTVSGAKGKMRRGNPAVKALKFEQPFPESSQPSYAWDILEEKPTMNGACPGKTESASHSADFLTKIEKDCKQEGAAEESNPRPKRRRTVHAKAREVQDGLDEGGLDEVDAAAMSSGVGLPHCERGGDGERPARRNTRRSARLTAVNGCAEKSPAPGGGCNSLQIDGKASDSADDGGSLDVLKSLDNGSESDAPRQGFSLEDRTQPTILSMFGGASTGRQCRRLGMRGRVSHRQQSPNNGVLPPIAHLSLSPSPSPSLSPEPRRSPRKSGTARPVAMTVSPRKRDSVVPAVPNSPTRPDEFPTHAVGGSTFDPVGKAGGRDPSVCARAWESACLESPKKRNGSPLSRNGEEEGVTALPLPFTDSKVETQTSLHSDSNHLTTAATTTTTRGADNSSSGRRTPPPSPSRPGLDRAVKVAGLSPVGDGVRGDRKRAAPMVSPAPGPSQPTVRLRNCDHLCNSPTISASAAIKALTGPARVARRVTFDQDTDRHNDQDSDEDEVSLGTKSSFKSVPLKSVSVKVENCDTVCSSPEKWVSARFATSCLAKQRAQRFHLMERLFQGTMTMRTRCLECERCTERKESFQDISVPLCAESSADSDSETDEEDNSCLQSMMHAFTAVERLREDNKYLCDQCARYTEAERSLHYSALPSILTLHLKRFTATGTFGCLSKINDHVAVPLLLSCLRYKCPKPCIRPDHRYTLFAIITHAGSTLSSGHYLAYIKVRPNAVGGDTLSAYLNTPTTPTTPTADANKNLHPSPQPATSPPDSDQLKKRTRSSAMSGKGDASSAAEDSPTPEVNRSWSQGSGQAATSSGDGPESSDYHWLECDDETIRILSEKEFESRLEEREGALRGTPYVLFYHRLDTWR